MAMSLYQMGYNVLSNVDEKQLDEQDRPVLMEGHCVLAACWASHIVERASGELSFITPGTDVQLRPGLSVKAFIGSDDFHLIHYQDGTLTDVSGKVLREHVLHCSMSNNSQILLVDETVPDHLWLFDDLEAFLEETASSGSVIPDGYTISEIVSGAGQFLIRTSPPALFSLGTDNRFGQLGRQADELLDSIDIFEGMQIQKVAMGDLHCAVIAEGSLYIWGCNKDSQCSGKPGVEPTLVDLKVGEGQEQPNIVDVGCGAAHTVLITDSGDVWVCGKNEFGQLGLGHRDTIPEFVKNDAISNASAVLCSRWTTYISVSNSKSKAVQ